MQSLSKNNLRGTPAADSGMFLFLPGMWIWRIMSAGDVSWVWGELVEFEGLRVWEEIVFGLLF